MNHQPNPWRPCGQALACLLAVAGAALLPGCAGSLLPQPAAPPARHTLDVQTESAMAVPAQRRPAADAPVLVVAVPRAAPGHDSTRMVYLRRPQELEAYATHAWIATPGQMLAPLIVHALQEAGVFGAVLLAPSSGTGAWRLETEVIRLQHDFTERPSRVRLTLRAVLIDTATRQVLAWREFDESVTAASEDPAGGVAAASEATRRVVGALAVFCGERVPPR